MKPSNPTGHLSVGTRVVVAAFAVTAFCAGSARAQCLPTTPRQYVEFKKNQTNPADSRLIVWDNGKAVQLWRAGSGDGNKDDCTVDHGWLPTGACRIGDFITNAYGAGPNDGGHHLLGFWNGTFQSPIDRKAALQRWASG